MSQDCVQVEIPLLISTNEPLKNCIKELSKTNYLCGNYSIFPLRYGMDDTLSNEMVIEYGFMNENYNSNGYSNFDENTMTGMKYYFLG